LLLPGDRISRLVDALRLALWPDAEAARSALELWGRKWLEHGTVECRFAKPVYDATSPTLIATETADGLDIKVESRGVLCATWQGRAVTRAARPAVTRQFSSRLPSPPSGRRPTEPRLRAENVARHHATLRVTQEMAEEYPRDVGERRHSTRERASSTRLIYNFALSRNVVLGPWMRWQHGAQFRCRPVGDGLGVRARVTAPVAHLAIYHPAPGRSGRLISGCWAERPSTTQLGPSPSSAVRPIFAGSETSTFEPGSQRSRPNQAAVAGWGARRNSRHLVDSLRKPLWWRSAGIGRHLSVGCRAARW
jgi:hypothetical protein